jgi:hypothetical protein
MLSDSNAARASWSRSAVCCDSSIAVHPFEPSPQTLAAIEADNLSLSTLIAVVLEVNRVTGKQHGTGVRQLDQQKLVPGVDRIVTLPSPKTSWSPCSLVTGCDGLHRGEPSWLGQSCSAC